jgi:IclR family transcriptional regulator, KDG regulon repressor
MKPATTVTKVCRILAEFRTRPSLGVSDLARRTELLPSDVHRILASLKQFGFIEQDVETKRYRLGNGLMRLGLTAFQQNILHSNGGPILSRLSKRLEAGTYLAVFDQRECEVFRIDQVDAPDKPLFEPRLGATENFHSSALGKTIMAYLDQQTLHRILEHKGFKKSTVRTIMSPETLETEFQLIRQRGYAVDREECVEGACCIASGVRDCTGAVIRAISASLEADRFYSSNQASLASQVIAAAAELSLALGYEARPWPVPTRRMSA